MFICILVYTITINITYNCDIHYIMLYNNLNKIGVFSVSHGHNCMYLFNQLLFLIVIEVHVPLCQAGFTGPVLYQDETNLSKNKGCVVSEWNESISKEEGECCIRVKWIYQRTRDVLYQSEMNISKNRGCVVSEWNESISKEQGVFCIRVKRIYI